MTTVTLPCPLCGLPIVFGVEHAPMGTTMREYRFPVRHLECSCAPTPEAVERITAALFDRVFPGGVLAPEYRS